LNYFGSYGIVGNTLYSDDKSAPNHVDFEQFHWSGLLAEWSDLTKNGKPSRKVALTKKAIKLTGL
jgi:hypothetical protein